MTLKMKLVLAQTPLVIAVAVIGFVSGFVTDRLGQQATQVLADNYRSVLAAQRMMEALERLNDGALMILLGRAEEAGTSWGTHLRGFKNELSVQRDNITEPGEREATARLEASWKVYAELIERYGRLSDRGARAEAYFRELRPTFRRAKVQAEEILTINQDAMVRKSQRAEKLAERFQVLVMAAVLATALLGLLGSIGLINRLLRPVAVVAATVRRFGGGDLKVRARIAGADEIGHLAREFNTMADRLERYRASSLGELIQAQQAAQAAIDGLPDPVVLLDPAGNLSGVNQEATSFLEIDPEKTAGDPFSRADPGIRAALDRFKAHVLGGRGAYLPRGFEEAIHLRLRGVERIFLPRATPIHGEAGQVAGVAVVFQDITRVFRSDELKNNLVATVAHELRTPLTSLRMAIHLVLEQAAGPLTTKQADLLHAGRDDCERLQSIVDDLLNLSRIESGRIDLQRRRVSPESLVSLALDIHRTAAEERQIGLRPEIYPGCPEAFADPERLQIVITNLLSNAIRYSPPGSEIVLSATAQLTSPREENDDHRLEGRGQIRFEVRDQGPGVPREYQDRMFEKFFRVPGTAEAGSGLGLFIAKGIVQAHGGRIGLDSEPGRGTTLWFTIPAAPEPATAE
jgi:NtrC-family two-component system sensor histidine kinase KinB